MLKLFSPVKRTNFNPKPSWEDEAVVETIIQQGQTWRARYQASSWTACCQKAVTLSPGDRVRVISISGIRLIVEPL